MSILFEYITPPPLRRGGQLPAPCSVARGAQPVRNGLITADRLTAAEDEAIRNLVAKEKAAGLRVVTDGEFRRATWHLDFMCGAW